MLDAHRRKRPRADRDSPSAQEEDEQDVGGGGGDMSSYKDETQLSRGAEEQGEAGGAWAARELVGGRRQARDSTQLDAEALGESDSLPDVMVTCPPFSLTWPRSLLLAGLVVPLTSSVFILA